MVVKKYLRPAGCGTPPLVKRGRESEIYLTAIRTESKKIHPVIDNSKSCFLFQFRCHMVQTGQIGVHYLPALGTDQMRMGIGLVAVVAVAIVTETKFQNFTELLDQ